MAFAFAQKAKKPAPLTDKGARSKKQTSALGQVEPVHSAGSLGFGQPVSASGGAPVIQAKLKIGEPDDQYEKEADRVAEEVMRMPEPMAIAAGTADTGAPGSGRQPGNGANAIQRMCTDCAMEEEDKLRRKPLADNALNVPRISALNGPVAAGFPLPQQENIVQRMDMDDEEEMMQMKPAGGGSAVPAVTPGIEAGINSLRGRGQPLTESTRAFFEPRFGMDFSGVRVHTDAQAAGTARSVQAKAFTTGRDIVFGAREYAPESEQGRQLLGHELVQGGPPGGAAGGSGSLGRKGGPMGLGSYEFLQSGRASTPILRRQKKPSIKTDLASVVDEIEMLCNQLESTVLNEEYRANTERQLAAILDDMSAFYLTLTAEELATVERARDLLPPPPGQMGSDLGSPPAEASCTDYKRNENEQKIARSDAGHLTYDVFTFPQGSDRLLVADFAVGSAAIKDSLRHDLILQANISDFEQVEKYQLHILGYTDCVGGESLNLDLRKQRTQAVIGLFSAKAKSRVVFTGAAPLSEYVTDNGSARERAMNRGVVIERTVPAPPKPEVIPPPFEDTPEEITVCTPPTAQTSPGKRCKFYVYDSTATGMAWKWKVAAFALAAPRPGAYVIPSGESIEEALKGIFDTYASENCGCTEEVQFWSHGSSGNAMSISKTGDEITISDFNIPDLDKFGDGPTSMPGYREWHDKLTVKQRRLVLLRRTICGPDAEIYYRSCEAFQGKMGQEFAKASTEFWRSKVVGHTKVIALTQPGKKVIKPCQEPNWSESEGTEEPSPKKPVGIGADRKPKKD